ncbi:MAG: glycoside hydrolase family 97 N-terminal domain-containing protein, partial [Ginsengibacter sp.]
MLLRQLVCLAVLFFWANYLFAQKNVNISSPNKQITFEFTIAAGKPEYGVKFKGQKLVEHSALSLAFEDGQLGNKASMQKAKVSKGVEEYDLPMGKASHVRSAYTQMIIALQEGDKKVSLQVRVFDDGLGMRYQFPEQGNQAGLVLTDERTNFDLSNTPTARVAFLDNYFTSHEHLYNVLPLADIKNDTLMDMPVLFEFPG